MSRRLDRLRPFTRRGELNDLEAARRLVASAELEALDRAEELQRRAEELLEAVTADPEAPAPPPAEDPVPAPTAALAALVGEVEEVVKAALAAAAREAARAARARAEAERTLRRAAEDGERIRADALAAGREEARRWMAGEAAQLRAVLDRAGAALERFMDPPAI